MLSQVPVSLCETLGQIPGTYTILQSVVKWSCVRPTNAHAPPPHLLPPSKAIRANTPYCPQTQNPLDRTANLPGPAKAMYTVTPKNASDGSKVYAPPFGGLKGNDCDPNFIS